MKSSSSRPWSSAQALIWVLGAVVTGAGHAANAQDAQNPDDGAPAAYGAPRANAGVPDGAARLAARRMMIEKRMRDMMARSGISAAATQDAILAFLRADEDEKRSVREASRRLWNGMQRDAPAERLRALLSDYQKALQNARDNRARAQTALDARVGYSLDARLESLLWLLGVLGEGQNTFVFPAPPRNARRAIAGNGAVNERQLEGWISAKNAPAETPVWLEVRDDAGRLWRMVPSDEPDAQPVLNRQIERLTPGTRVSVRVSSPLETNPQAPLSLLAIVSSPEKTQQIEMDEQGADDAPDGQ